MVRLAYHSSMSFIKIKLAVLSVLWAWIALPSFAWGPDGHRVAGAIAQAYLTEEAKAGIKDLLGEETLAEAGLWADDIRQDPAYDFAKPLHYVNVPRDAQRVNVKEVCDSGQCVLGAIEKYEKQLRDQTLPREQRIEALKFLIHFIEDVHQPLHVSFADDRGGNSIPVTLFGEADWNLHSVWDTGLIRQKIRGGNGDWNALAESIRKDLNDRQLKKLRAVKNPVAWANESLDITHSLYPHLPKDGNIDGAYYAKYMPTVEDRLAAAGVRLAMVLNDVFAGKAKPGTTSQPALN